MKCFIYFLRENALKFTERFLRCPSRIFCSREPILSLFLVGPLILGHPVYKIDCGCKLVGFYGVPKIYSVAKISQRRQFLAGKRQFFTALEKPPQDGAFAAF